MRIRSSVCDGAGDRRKSLHCLGCCQLQKPHANPNWLTQIKQFVDHPAWKWRWKDLIGPSLLSLQLLTSRISLWWPMVFPASLTPNLVWFPFSESAKNQVLGWGPPCGLGCGSGDVGRWYSHWLAHPVCQVWVYRNQERGRPRGQSTCITRGEKRAVKQIGTLKHIAVCTRIVLSF